jgi:hypothetical protein
MGKLALFTSSSLQLHACVVGSTGFQIYFTCHNYVDDGDAKTTLQA